MNKKLLFGGFLLLGLIFFICQFIGSDEALNEEYINQIKLHRERYHEHLKYSEKSPFVQKNVAYSTPIDFFDIDPKYQVSAQLEQFTKKYVLELAKSDGTSGRYTKYAIARFSLKGKDFQLLILKPMRNVDYYFLAFGDQTNGNATYGSGRYVEVEIGDSNEIIIDFNKAYNPYCAYVDGFSCPFPPKENYLELPVEAGERNYFQN